MGEQAQRGPRQKRNPNAFSVLLVAALMSVSAALGGCAGSSSTSTSTKASTGSSPGAISGAGTPSHPRHHLRHHKTRGHKRQAPAPGGAGLVFSLASNRVVALQPPPGSCHAIGSGPSSRPDPSCTPGALDPAVRQSTIEQTICVPGWTSTVRPPESVTEREKVASLAAYGAGGPLGAYEYDHFVPLELGGATNDPRNLWPQPGGSPNPKDAVESRLREEVCAGTISLARAQRAIVADWVALRSTPGTSPHPGGGAAPSVPGAECSVSGAYSRRYHDYDVYVHSNQPDQRVTVTDTTGHSDSWHTDASGYADVYLRTGGEAAGRRISARVGRASCSGSL